MTYFWLWCPLSSSELSDVSTGKFLVQPLWCRWADSDPPPRNFGGRTVSPWSYLTASSDGCHAYLLKSHIHANQCDSRQNITPLWHTWVTNHQAGHLQSSVGWIGHFTQCLSMANVFVNQAESRAASLFFKESKEREQGGQAKGLDC